MLAKRRTKAERSILPQRPGQWLILAILILALLFYVMPVYVMVVTGLKDARNVSLATMWNLPTVLAAGGFAEACRIGALREGTPGIAVR